MDQDQTPHILTDSPVGIGTNHYANLAVDPVTGHFIVITSTKEGDVNDSTRFVWELDPIAKDRVSGRPGVWIQLTGTNVPPAMTGDPMSHGLANPRGLGVISGPIPKLGVIMYVTGIGAHNEVWLYKHSAPVVSPRPQ